LVSGTYRLVLETFRLVRGTFRLVLETFRLVCGTFRLVCGTFRLVCGTFRLVLETFRLVCGTLFPAFNERRGEYLLKNPEQVPARQGRIYSRSPLLRCLLRPL
jgi:hypothetical protein